MKRRFKLALSAQRDLVAIADDIGRDDRAAARRWVNLLVDRARKASHHPFAGRRVEEYERDDIREVIVGNYRLIYRVTATAVVITFVIEGHRLLGPLED